MTDSHVWRMQWSNFRGYAKSPVIEFPAMTLLIGRNNVGKTSAYAPLLLLRQTLEARSNRTALLFRGSLADFGSYADVVTDHETSREIGFRLDFGAEDHRITLRGEKNVRPRALQVSFGQDQQGNVRVMRSIVTDDEGQRVVSRFRQKTGIFRVTSPFLPENRDVGRPYKEVTELRRQLTGEEPNGFLFSGRGGLLLPRAWREDRDRWSKVQGWYSAASSLFDIYFELNSYIENALQGLAYIGPLRSSPLRTYMTSAEPPVDVGRDGEWATEVLYQSSREKNHALLEETNAWLVRLGYGDLEFEEAGEFYQVYVRQLDSGLRVNIADCGMGLSQLLPLIVQGCAMPIGSTLIAQQPEIHLNPAQQDLMTDFLIHVCETGKRVIVETHSEHILGRLRRRIAEGETIGSGDVAIYYCDSSDARSTLRRIEVGGMGEIEADEWPTGFFNEQLTNSMEMARAQSRRRRASE